MPDGDGKRGVVSQAAGQELSAIERRELRRRASVPLTDEQFRLYIELAIKDYEEVGLPGQDYMPV